MKETLKHKTFNEFQNRFTIFILCLLVGIFTMAPEIVQAQRGRHGPGGPSHMHGHHHGHPHVIGHIVRVLAVTAIVVTVVNKNNQKQQYQYDNGTYYQETQQDGQTAYVVVPAPIGAKVPTLPSDNTPITVGSTVYYYYASTFYTQSGSDYVVVQPPVGATVPYAPDGYEKKEVNSIQYYVINGIYYLPKSNNGDIVYEVVEHP
jgi:hypothetical protein